jgi:UDP-N-acetylglucosamine transferase subunit ALG13
VDCHYIESAARSDGPSITGRIAARIPGVRTYTQYRSLTSSRWQSAPSIFDEFEGSADLKPASLRKVVVTLGTVEGFGFRSLIDRLLTLLPAETDVLWQTGSTDVAGLPIEGVVAMPQRDLMTAMQEADVVIAHAGIGSALGAMEAGRMPLLVPRRRSRAEHVDDHQIQIARELDARGLAVYRHVTRSAARCPSSCRLQAVR